MTQAAGRLSLATIYRDPTGLGWPAPAARPPLGPATAARPADDPSGPRPDRLGGNVAVAGSGWVPGTAGPAEPDQAAVPVLATPWQRLCGWLIDAIICAALGSAAWIPAVRPHLHRLTELARQYPHHSAAAANALLRQVIMPSLNSFALAAIAATCLCIAYHWLLTGLFGATIGKRIAGTKVIATNTWHKPRLGAAFFRAVVFIVGPVIFGIFFLADTARVLWDPQRQCLHDKAGRTLVVRRRPG